MAEGEKSKAEGTEGCGGEVEENEEMEVHNRLEQPRIQT